MATVVSVLRVLAQKKYRRVDRGTIVLAAKNPATAGQIIRALEVGGILVPAKYDARGKPRLWDINWKKAYEWYADDIPEIEALAKLQDEYFRQAAKEDLRALLNAKPAEGPQGGEEA